MLQSSSLGEPQNKCSEQHATTCKVVQLQEKLDSKEGLTWKSTRNMIFNLSHLCFRCTATPKRISTAYLWRQVQFREKGKNGRHSIRTDAIPCSKFTRLFHWERKNKRNIETASPIASSSHTHPSHSQTSRLLTLSLSLGVPVPRPTQCMRGV